ncbi:MAG: diguanylate cyclase [Pseudomonadales bacterium]|nr:diguanylate cyclase [Pseudomonadales bacterium]
MFEVPIVIIKKTTTDEKFFATLLAAFPDKRYYSSGIQALQSLEQNPAALAVIESETEDMEGIEIAEAIRDIDAEASQFTYIVIYGGEPTPMLEHAFSLYVDANIPATLPHTLSQVVAAGCRLSKEIGTIKNHNLQLQASNQELEHSQLLDPLTGLGNRKYAELCLRDSIRQIESRGGAVCVLVISILNLPAIVKRYDNQIGKNLVVAIGEKITNLVRPLDLVSYYKPYHFVLVLTQPNIENCTAACYQRIYEGIKLKSFPTAAGFLNADIAMSICASHAEHGAPDPDHLMKIAEQHLELSQQQENIYVHHLTPAQ